MDFNFTVQHRIDLDNAFGRLIVQHLTDISDQLASIAKQVKTTEKTIMVSIQDLKTKAATQLAAITAETDVVNAVKAVVDGQNEKLAALKQQVADLIASGSVDPADMQQLSDTLDAIAALDTSNAAVVSAAVAAGTPVAQPTPTT